MLLVYCYNSHMSIFGNSGAKEELALVFDIGSSSVGVALFMTNTGAPKIIYSFREPIALEDAINFDRFLALTIKSLEVVANKVCMQALGAPKKIYCVLASPWYASQTRTIRMEKNAPFIFTKKLADSLLEKEAALFEEEHLTGAGHKCRKIELRSMRTALNGYVTQSPIGQKASEAEITVFMSMSPEAVLQKFEEAVGRHFHSKNVQFSSFVMAAFAVARDMFVSQESFLLVDIGGEVTDISMVKKDMLRESLSFPMGRNYMIRGLCESFSCSLDEAKSFIHLYKDAHADPATEKKLSPIIEKLRAEWLKKFQESLVNLSNDISIPATIFITVDPQLADFFAETIKTEQFNQYTLTESKFRVVFLGTEALHGIATFEEKTIRDPFLIIEAIYINRFLK